MPNDVELIANHEDRAADALISLLRRPRLEALVRLVGAEAQELEDTLHALLTERRLDTALGAQLDQLGAVLGERRSGLEDLDYRALLGARILSNLSCGEPWRLAQVLSILMRSPSVRYVPFYPAALWFQVGTSAWTSSMLRARTRAQLQAIAPAGVAVEWITEHPLSGAFGFDDDPDPTTLGFDEGAFAEVI